MIADALRSLVPRPPAQQDPAPGYFPLMDSVRAIAATSIFLFHVPGEFGTAQDLADFSKTLAAGVPVFFVISGFLLYRPFTLAYQRGEPTPSAAAYGWRRFLRIVPAFWVALTIYVLLGSKSEAAGDLPLLYGFAQVYDQATLTQGIGAAWSLDCEVVYYVLIPLLMITIRGGRSSDRSSGTAMRRELISLAALIVLSAAYKAWFYSWKPDGTLVSDSAYAFHPAWNLDLFVLGMALAVWSARRQIAGRDDRLVAFVDRFSALLWLTAAALLAIDHLSGASELTRHALRAGIAVCVVLPAICGDHTRGAVRRILAFRPLLALGIVSYSFYLFHVMVMGQIADRRPAALDGTAGDVALVLAAFGATAAVSVVMWVVVEHPALKLKRLVRGRPGRPRVWRLGPALAGAAALVLLVVPGAATRDDFERLPTSGPGRVP